MICKKPFGVALVSLIHCITAAAGLALLYCGVPEDAMMLALRLCYDLEAGLAEP